MVKHLSEDMRSILVRLTKEQKAQLDADARHAGLRQNAYIEQKLFGQFRPREGNGPSPYLKTEEQQELPLTG
ncbi:MAG: hypothetical protein ACK5MR_09630 [Cumulibacter sp.]